MMKKVFFAGATSYTGKTLLALPESSEIDLVIHVRPDSPNLDRFAEDPRLCKVDLNDTEALASAMQGCQGVLSTIGTVKARFKKENVTYESVDFQTTVALVEAAKKAGVEHFALMSSIGAGSEMGAYYKWKRKAELAVIQSGIDYTIFRPSYLVGGERKDLPGATPVMKGLGKLPGLSSFADNWRPIPIEVVAWNFLRVLQNGSDKDEILNGRELWQAWNNRQ